MPKSETHYFDFELFKSCADTNIQLLVKLIKKVAEIYQAIENVNAIEITILTYKTDNGQMLYPNYFPIIIRRDRFADGKEIPSNPYRLNDAFPEGIKFTYLVKKF